MKKFFCMLAALLSIHTLCGEEHYIIPQADGLKGHLQGIIADESGIYWSHFNILLKTDYEGKKIAAIEIPPHAGGVCLAGDRVFVSMALRGTKVLNAHERCRSWVFEFDAKTLELVKKHKRPELPSLDGITFYDGKFYVGKGAPRKPHPTNEILIYDREWKLLETRTIDIGQTTMYGAQMLNVINGRLLAGFYGDKKKKGYFFELNDFSKPVATFPVRGSFGLALVPESATGGEKDVFLVAEVTGKKPNFGARIRVVKYVDGKLKPFNKKLLTK